MKARVNPYESATFRGIRYHQGSEFEFKNLEEIEGIKGQITVLGQVEEVEETMNQEEA